MLASEPLILRSAPAVLLGAKGAQTASSDSSNQFCIADAGLKFGMQLSASAPGTMLLRDAAVLHYLSGVRHSLPVITGRPGTISKDQT